MARKARQSRDASSDDDAPEAVSHSASKADAKRTQRALRDFETEERARRKARNRERDLKLKERARVTKRTREQLKGVRFADQESEDREGDSVDEGGDGDDVEARMLRAMREAADEAESIEEGEEEADDEFAGFRQKVDLGDDMASGSDGSFAQDEDDDDAGMSFGESDSIDPEAPTDDEEMDEDEEEETIPLRPNTQASTRKSSYLADDLFTAAFASQDSKPSKKKNAESIQQQTAKKQRRKSTTRPKDLVMGYGMSLKFGSNAHSRLSGRTIRTLPCPSDPRSQATARSVPSARARKFVDQNLAIRGKQALLKAKKKGWERRPANVGVMKYQGAPHAFVRSTR